MEFRVLVVDDYGLIRDSLTTIIQVLNKGAIVDTAATKAEVVELLGEHRYDFIFLDLTLDGETKPGFELIDLCVASQSGKTVALSGHSDCVTIRAAIEHGATSFIKKNYDNPTMLKAVDAIFSGLDFVPTKVLHSTPERSKLGQLNEREVNLLSLIARGKLHKEIGSVTGMKEISVRDSARRLYRKLEVRNRSEAARIFWAAVPAGTATTNQ
ncbi:MAG: response regulator transcription factor [Usitatibacteraceae bacterium]